MFFNSNRSKHWLVTNSLHFVSLELTSIKACQVINSITIYYRSKNIDRIQQQINYL